MSGNAFDYDLLVIGSGPAGQRAAIQGAKLNKKVAIVERRAVLGGCSVNLGTIPSKTLREAALELCGYRSREFYGASYTVKQHITMQDLLFRTDRVIQHEIDVTRHQLMRNNVERSPRRHASLAPTPFASTTSMPLPPARPRQKRSSSPPGRKPPAIRTFRSTANGSSPATTSCNSTGCRGPWRLSEPA